MAYLHCEIVSKSLEMATAFTAILPEEGDLGDCPVVYLLHGLSDNCTGWSRYTSVERYARELGAAVIMPEVQRSFYTDMAYGLRYFTYILEELPQVCRRMFGLSLKREKNYVMGLSMGGYGAMKCALTAPKRFAGCAAFSAVAEIQDWNRISDENRIRELKAIFGPKLEAPMDARLDMLLEKSSPEDLPAFFLTCGEQDALYPGNCRFASALEEKGARVTFRHWPGDHTWQLWDDSVRMAMNAFLGSEEKP